MVVHGETKKIPLEKAIASIKAKAEKRGDLPHASVSRQLELLNELASFPLGQFLLQHGGIDGYWTHYIITYPEDQKKVSSLEEFVLTKLPFVLATQERYQIFMQEIQKLLKNHMHLASIPCGLMGELLSLDYSQVKDIRLTGIDLDDETIGKAKEYAKEKGFGHKLEFHQKDAWKMEDNAVFDLISSSGLNIYETNEERVIELYRRFFNALQPQGVLVTSFLTYPPNFGVKSEWKISEISLEAALIQKILLFDLVESRFQGFRSSKEMEKILHQAGFKEVQMIYDKARIFPTVVGRK